MPETRNEINQYLSFEIGEEKYAIPVLYVREVLEVPQITRIPKMPPHMRGVINLRGAVVPLVDLRVRFGMTETDLSDTTAIIVLEIPTDEENQVLCVGAFADAVSSVISIDKSAISSPPDIGSPIDTGFILGMGHHDGNFLLLLDVASIFGQEDLETIESVHANDEILD